MELSGKGGGTGEGSAATKRAKPRPEPKYLMLRLERDSHIGKLLIALAKQGYRTPQDQVAFLVAEAAKPRPASAVAETAELATSGGYVRTYRSPWGQQASMAELDWSRR